LEPPVKGPDEIKILKDTMGKKRCDGKNARRV
jgi:hypothetical protein